MPTILEPMMAVEIIVPTEFQASSLQSINGREGTVEDTSPVGQDSTLVNIFLVN